jgi:hypothetical protein
MTGREIESIEDVRAALAEVRQTLADVQQADLTDPEARVLVQPLLELQNALARTAAQISELTR